MQSIKNVVAALRRELDAALADPSETASSHGLHIEPERIVLALELAISERQNQGGVEPVFSVQLENKKAPGQRKSSREFGRHHLTIEFKATRRPNPFDTTALPPVQVSSNPPLSDNAADGADLIKVLSSVLGAPGFDSSARATVFREALADLSEEEARAVINSLTVSRAAALEGKAKRARHLIVNVLRSGPLNSRERGGEVLTALLQKSSVATIIGIVAEQWKTQEDWLDKTLPRPASNGEPPREPPS